MKGIYRGIKDGNYEIDTFDDIFEIWITNKFCIHDVVRRNNLETGKPVRVFKENDKIYIKKIGE